MAEGLGRKRRIRAGHRGVATKRLHELGSLLTAGDRPDPLKLAQLKLSLREKLDTLRRLDNEVVELIEDEEVLTQDIELADTFNQSIYEALVNIDKHSEGPPTATPIPTGHASHAPSSRARLPKLTLRTFDGDLTKWMTFWDSYETAIHKNVELSDIDKFTYLKSLVERSAKEAISGLTLTSANYQEAIVLLGKRFGNKQQIIAKHMDTLLSVEAVTSQHNLTALRRLYDRVESHVRGLKALGVTADSYGSLLSSVLVRKLPPELQLIVSRKVSDDEWGMDALMGVLEEELKARERTATTPREINGRRGRDQPTSATLMTGSHNASSNGSCCYCQQGHTSEACQTVTRVDARKQILKGSGRCFICLRKGHISRECRSSGRCFKCGGRHHVSICYGMRQTASDPPAEITRSSPGRSSRPGQQTTTLNPAATPFGTTPTTSLYVDHESNNTVLLQTAKAIIFNPGDPAIQEEVRLVLDSGSQRSYITEQMKEALSLRSRGKKTMSIMTFGSSEEKRQVCDVVKVGMQMKEGPSQELSLLSVPLICEPLASPPVRLCIERYNHLRQLDLADLSGSVGQFKPDILIGSDYYWELITGETIRGSDGPVAIQTRLGWVLSGPISDTGNSQPSANLITHVLRVGTDTSSDNGKLDEQLRSFWELESLGIKDPEQSVYEEFERNIHLKNGRYEVTLPWKEPHPTLFNNYQLSLKRLQGLLHRLRQNPAVFREYDLTIRNQISQGIVQVVEKPECSDGEIVHYLPHHAVLRQNKETTKLRVVYDASAKSEGPSLNDCLYAGPKFDQRIMNILLRFRTHRVALTADIEKAFLMVSMAEKLG